jgi:hypothetical protein
MSEELTALRSVLGDVDGPSDRAWSEARAALMAEIEGVSGSVPARRSRRWMSAAGLVATLGVAAAVLLATQVFVRGGAVQPASAAAAVLRRAADAALASPPARLKPGQYWYTENIGTYRDVGTTQRGLVGALVSEVSQLWVGRERLLSRTRIVKVAPAAGSRPWQQRAIRSFFRVGVRSARSSARGIDVPVSYQAMLRAPRSRSALARWVLHAESAPGFTPKPRYRAQIMFTTIHDILIEPMVPARVRAGLYRVAATVQGVRMLGRTQDTLGRAALAVGFRDHASGYEDELLFDPVSYALLDYRETAVARIGAHLPAGSVMEETAFLHAGVVHRFGQVLHTRP